LSDPKFTLQALEMLQRYFPIDGFDPRKPSFNRLKGYLTALACAPILIPFTQWWGALKELTGLEFDSEQAENDLLPLMMTLMDKSLESVASGQVAIPEPVDLSQYDYSTAPVEQWCQGFMEGLGLSEEVWFSLEDKGEQESLELSFGLIALLASRENMRRKVDAEQFDERMNSAQQMLPQVVERIYSMGKSQQFTRH